MDQEEYPLQSNDLKAWQDLYHRIFTLDGKESITQRDGTKQLILMPMITYTLISTLLQKLKYLPNQYFNRMVIGKTPLCGLRSIDSTSPPRMVKLTEILRIMVDGVRKQQILSITLIFYKKNNINIVYDSYSLVMDYNIHLPENQSNTSLNMIAHMIHQIEYMLSWNDSLPDDAELTFVISALDQFNHDTEKIPQPFGFVKQTLNKVYSDHETTRLLGRLTTPNGKLWLKFLPHTQDVTASSIRSEDLPTAANMFTNQPNPEIDQMSKPKRSVKITTPTTTPPIVISPKLKKAAKKTTSSKGSNQSEQSLPSSTASTTGKAKKKTGLLAAVKSLITPSRAPAPITSSTPNQGDLVLIPHTSTPKPGETASRIIIGGRQELPPLSAIYEGSTPNSQRPIAQVTSPTPSSITATDMSTAFTPTLTIESRPSGRTSTVRGQAALARKKIAAMQIRDADEGDKKSDEADEDESEDDEEQFKRLFTQRRSKRSKKTSTKNNNDLSQISSISSASSTIESVFTPPTARKRATTDRADADDLATEHGTPPKTPRTGRRNRADDLTISLEGSMMDTSDLPLNIDSPRLLRSVTKKLQQQAAEKKQLVLEEAQSAADQTKTQQGNKQKREKIDHPTAQERSSIALHYSMEESD